MTSVNLPKVVFSHLTDDELREALALRLYNPADAMRQLSEQDDYKRCNAEHWLARLSRGDRCIKLLSVASTQQVHEMLLLADTFPNFRELARLLAGALTLQVAKNLPIRLPKVLLQGEPGCGKTEFVRAVAETLKLPLIEISLSAQHGEFELQGSHRTWSTAEPGRLWKALFYSELANPIFLFDEAERGNERTQSALYAWLENNVFEDQFLDLHFKIAQVNSFLITNDLHRLSPAIISRCQAISVRSPNREEQKAIVRRIYTKWREHDEFAEFSETVSNEVVDKLLDGSLRNVRHQLQCAMYTAALEHRTVLLLEDLRPATIQRSMGFTM